MADRERYKYFVSYTFSCQLISGENKTAFGNSFISLYKPIDADNIEAVLEEVEETLSEQYITNCSDPKMIRPETVKTIVLNYKLIN